MKLRGLLIDQGFLSTLLILIIRRVKRDRVVSVGDYPHQPLCLSLGGSGLIASYIKLYLLHFSRFFVVLVWRYLRYFRLATLPTEVSSFNLAFSVTSIFCAIWQRRSQNGVFRRVRSRGSHLIAFFYRTSVVIIRMLPFLMNTRVKIATVGFHHPLKMFTPTTQ